jgi:hypothetical protein
MDQYTTTPKMDGFNNDQPFVGQLATKFWPALRSKDGIRIRSIWAAKFLLADYQKEG